MTIHKMHPETMEAVCGADSYDCAISWANVTCDDCRAHRLLTTPLTTATEAAAWIHAMYAAGYGTHPDDSAAEIVNAGTGEALFSADQAPLHDARMAEVFALLDDPYAVALDAHNGAGK